ncbi:MAG: sortase family protein [Acidobacteriales bacterium]|nr:sortase family protein [Terriglobales bacterium]
MSTPRSSSKQVFLRGMTSVFLILAIASLGYIGFSLVDAKAFQVSANWRLNKSTESSRLSAVKPQRTSAPIPAVAVRAVAPTSGLAIGRLEINRIGVSVIIAEGADDETLRRAVGHVTGTALPGEVGNVALAGHRDTFFRALRNIQLDDEVTVTTPAGSYVYKVDSMEVVAPSDTEVLAASNESILTLVTCYPFYFVGPAPRRFIVRAHRT